MNSKKINIVTINLNNKEGLENTIKSVINQTYFDKVNYIVIDGGSTDGSKDVLEEHKQYFDYYESRKDNGRYNAMNKGIDKAVGDYILFLNSGDYLHDNNVLETIYDALDGTTDIIYGGMNVHAIQGRQYVINDDYYLNKGLPHSSSFIKLSLLKENKYNEEYNIISDWIFFYEQIYLNKASYKQLDTLVSDFHIGGISSDYKAIKEEKTRYLNALSAPKIAMCSIGRLENKYVREFVEFYQKIGVDKFFIYDNNYDGEEHFEDVLKPYVTNGLVQVINFRNKEKCQVAAYQDCYNKYGEDFDWICFFDFDEFLYLDGYKTLKDLLSQEIYNGYELFHVNEMLYGDSGLLRYEDKLVVERFKTPVMPLDYKKTYDFPENCHVKSIVRGKLGGKVRWNATPHTPTGNLKCCNALGEQCNGNSPFVIPYIHKNIWLRHYKTKTIEEFYNTKVRRGYPDGNKDFFKTHSWVEDFFKENEKTDEKLAIIREIKDKEKNKMYEGPISIVIPCYNQGKYVRDTIISVKASRFKDFCCVIVNDGSTDNSEEVILDEIKGDDRFKYFKIKNQGLSHARNFGISKTKSKYIMCLDSDDLISPYYIGEGIEFLEKYNEFSIFYGKAKFLYEEDGSEVEWKLRPYSYQALLISNMIYCSHIFRRNEYDKTRGYDESMYGFQDWEFLVQLLDNDSNVYMTNNTVFYYRRHKDSMDYEIKNQRNRYLLAIFEKNKEKYIKNKIMVVRKQSVNESK